MPTSTRRSSSPTARGSNGTRRPSRAAARSSTPAPTRRLREKTPPWKTTSRGISTAGVVSPSSPAPPRCSRTARRCGPTAPSAGEGGARRARARAPASLSAATPSSQKTSPRRAAAACSPPEAAWSRSRVPLPKRICRLLDLLDPSSSPGTPSRWTRSGAAPACSAAAPWRSSQTSTPKPTPPKPTPPAPRLFPPRPRRPPRSAPRAARFKTTRRRTGAPSSSRRAMR